MNVMSKRVRNQNKVKKKSSELKKSAPELPAQDDKPENGYDFSGLPNVNLKKNLGCG